MASGYSGTSLVRKLGILESTKVLLVAAPPQYMQLLEVDISSQLVHSNETPDLVHLFVKTEKEFIKEMEGLKKFCKENPKIVIWVSWYKKSAKIPTDMTEETIRQYALSHDLVDVKVCAVSDVWSGLKLVVPLAKRK